MAELLLLALIIYNNTQSVPLRVSPETTWITEPLTPDGKLVDYIAAYKRKLYPPEIATADNGYRLVLQRILNEEKSLKLPPGLVQKYRAELGLDQDHKPDLIYRDFYGFISDTLKNEPKLLDNIAPQVMEGVREQRASAARLFGGKWGNPDGGLDASGYLAKTSRSKTAAPSVSAGLLTRHLRSGLLFLEPHLL